MITFDRAFPDIREFLSACRGAAFEIKAIEKQREAVRLGGAQGVASLVISDNTSDTNNRTARALDNLDYYDQLLVEKRNEQIQKLGYLETLLTKLLDGKDRAIMRYFYGQGLSDAYIADALDASDRTVRERRRKTIRYLEAQCVTLNTK